MRNLLRITNYYNNIEAKKDYYELKAKMQKYGLLHLLPVPTTETWRKLDNLVSKTKSVTLRIQSCPKCECGGDKEFTISLGEVLDAEGFIACDYCDTPLYPLERSSK